MAELLPPAPPRRHLLSIADLERDGRRAHPRHGAVACGVARSRDEEAADAPRSHGREPLLRVVDAHAGELRARREAPLRRHDVAALDRLLGRQGRVAQGHGADARGVRAGRDRRPPSVDRRAAARRAAHRRARRERGRREAPAPDAGAPRPVHDARGARPPRGAPRRDRRRRSPLAGRALARPGARARRQPDCRSSARRRSSPEASRRSVARCRTTSPRSPTPTSSTSCGCSASAWGRRSCRRYASTRRCTASRPSRVRAGQVVMHPGPMNRGVEIDPRVADSEAALVTDQVRAGLVVRMAVLYDVLTVAPVADARAGGGRADARRAERSRRLAHARGTRARAGPGDRRVAPHHGRRRRHQRASSRRCAARSSSHPRSSIRTSTCAHRVARTRRRSARAPRQPLRAATARSSRCRTRSRSSTRRPCSARSSSGRARTPSCRPGSWPRSARGSSATS